MVKYTKSHEEYSTTPLTISPMHNAWPSQILIDLLDGRKAGVDTFCIHKNKGLEFFADYDAWDKGSDYLINKIRKDPNFVDFVYKKHQEIATECLKLIRGFFRIDISKMSNQEIADFLFKSYKLGNDFSAFGYVPVFSDHMFHKFTHLLKDIIKNAKFKIDFVMSIPEILYQLSSPVELMPSKLAQIELLQLSLGSNLSEQKIKDYYLDWFWVDHGQIGPARKLSDVKEVIKKFSVGKELVQNELSDLLNTRDKVSEIQKNIGQELNLTEEEKYLFSVARKFTYLKGLRMEILFGISACWSVILEEIGKRFGVNKDLLYYASVEELNSLLLEKKELDVDKLIERSKYCVWVAKSEMGQDILIGDEADNFLKSLDYIQDKNLENVLVIHGTVASTGYAKGRVKIVNKTEEINKVEEGDILLSVATHPGLLPAMKKAAGFVTDAGGITSHAAIVARELKKPCIIGTRIATKVLKDGDTIEVDAILGIIRIVGSIK